MNELPSEQQPGSCHQTVSQWPTSQNATQQRGLRSPLCAKAFHFYVPPVVKFHSAPCLHCRPQPPSPDQGPAPPQTLACPQERLAKEAIHERAHEGLPELPLSRCHLRQMTRHNTVCAVGGGGGGEGMGTCAPSVCAVLCGLHTNRTGQGLK